MPGWGKDALAKVAMRGLESINILSWLPGRLTAMEMLRLHKTDKCISLLP